MCMTVLNEDFEVKVADEDIVCFKVLTKFRASPYQHYQYPEAGVVVTSVLATQGESPDGCRYSNVPPSRDYSEGLHSFVYQSDAEWEAADWGIEGMTAWKAMIPKGSRYFEGRFSRRHDVYMSDALVLVEPVFVYTDDLLKRGDI